MILLVVIGMPISMKIHVGDADGDDDDGDDAHDDDAVEVMMIMMKVLRHKK